MMFKPKAKVMTNKILRRRQKFYMLSTSAHTTQYQGVKIWQYKIAAVIIIRQCDVVN
jgi:hypothetical protein